MAKQPSTTDLTTSCPRAILRLVVTAVVSPLQGGDATTRVLGRPFSLAKRAGRVARDVARCPRRCYGALTPGFLFARDLSNGRCTFTTES